MADDDFWNKVRIFFSRIGSALMAVLRWIALHLQGPKSSTHGLVPFVVWMCFFFGGIWFPATAFLNHIFNGATVPAGFPVPSGFLEYAVYIALSFLFWTWTNMASLCLLASAMGEVSRGWRDSGYAARYTIACTRGFFIYLLVLLNEIAVVGRLTGADAGSGEAQAVYVRLSILASLLCFVASNRPEFFEGLVGRFAQNNQPDTGANGPDPAAPPGQPSE